MPNHIHLLISLSRNDLPKLIGDIKRSSSVWMKRKGVGKFYWQRGYGAFSIGQSQVAEVSRYIRNQKEHHTKQDYQEELRSLCRKYEVEIDERFAWD
jgi:REP element-mobilizing transposase RayT